MGILATSFRFVVATAFLLAGMSKLPRLGEFEIAVRGYGLVPEASVDTVARVLPVVELGFGLLLLVGVGIRYVAALLAILLIVFIVAIAMNLLAGRELDCGCFGGGGPTRLTWRTVGRNTVLLTMATVTAVWWPAALSVDSLIGRAHGSVGNGSAFAMLICGTTAVLGALCVSEGLRVYGLMQARAFEHQNLR